MIKFKFPEPNSESVIETLDRIRKNAEVQKDFGDIKMDAYDFFWMVQQIKISRSSRKRLSESAEV